MYLGHEPNVKGYRLYTSSPERTIVSRNVVFNETKSFFTDEPADDESPVSQLIDEIDDDDDDELSLRDETSTRAASNGEIPAPTDGPTIVPRLGECISEDEKRIPKNVTELLQALVSVLEALVVLHSIGWMHRDIRWANVVKKNNSAKWFLIDFDDAAKSPKQNNPGEHLTSQAHAPDMFGNGSHTTSVDIWAVGNLILTDVSWDHMRSKVLDDYGRRLVDANPEKRPKAGEVLKTIKAMLDEKEY
ncbi:hypothetical protein AC1031_018113 [Aphanomyces cochlioides]|nr:hypothetical protein AC1031_018113 [Aphanomyces cochlioides]